MGVSGKDFAEKREYQHLKEKGEISNAEYTKSILNKTKSNNSIVIKDGNFDSDTLKETKATDLNNLYTPMLTMLSDMENEFNELVAKEITADLSKDAKALRIRISKVRINADKARKDGKAEILRAGNAIQGAYNTLAFAVTSKEEKLLSIEKHFENLEKERIAKLQVERENELTDLGIESIPFELGEMSVEVWDNYILGVKLAKEHKEKAEKQAELTRLENERLEKERLAKIEYENKRLKEESKEKERIAKEEKEKIEKETLIRKERNKKRSDELKPYSSFITCHANILDSNDEDYQAQLITVKKKDEEKRQLDKKEADKKQKEKDELNAKLKKERLAKEKLEKEIQAKKDAELKELQAKAANEKALLLAPDKDKLIKLANDLLSYPLPKLESDEANLILSDVKKLLNKISNHITANSKNL